MSEEQVHEAPVANPASPVPERPSPEEMRQLIDDLFADLAESYGDLAPPRADYDRWKEANNTVRFVGFGEQDNFFLRPIRGNEWYGFLERVRKIEDPELRERSFMEQVVITCTLWPRLDPTTIVAKPAGTVPSLFEMIRDMSNFVHPNSTNVIVLDL